MRALRLEHLVRRKIFKSDEPEFGRLGAWLRPGDIALDIGANFGSYTLEMSRLVGEGGRVFAFEPVPQTFAMLVRAVTARSCGNVTTLNLACSNEIGFARMYIPDDPLTGEDLYQASLNGAGPNAVVVWRVRIDSLPLPVDRIRLVKVDAEGHDAAVIDGMHETLRHAMPVLISEHPKDETRDRLQVLGYRFTRLEGSPNGIFLPPQLPE